MHQQYVAPGVARQSFFQGTKWQLAFVAIAVFFGFWVVRPAGSSDFLGLGGGGNTTTTGGAPNTNDLNAAGGTNPNVVPTHPAPQADFTVNAAAIGDTATPLPRTRPDGGTQNKGGYAEEQADLAAADAMVDKDPVKALQMVDQHDIDYPRGMLDPEARVVRVEAYAKKGDDAKALALGNEFLEDYPHSPRAGRVMAIVETLKNKLDAGRP
jgi:TolA-binding protein